MSFLLLSLYRNRVMAALLFGMLVTSGCARSPEDKRARFMEEGKTLLAKKDPARAVLQFQNAVQVTPKNAEVYYQLGQAYLAAGDIRNGILGLHRALELNPKHQQAQLRLSQLMASTADAGILKDAQQRLKTLLQDTPDNPEALHALALTELKLGDSGDGILHLERALAAAPQELVFAVTLAEAKWEEGDRPGAEAILKKASENAPKSADAAAILGYFYAKQNRSADAEQQYRRALAIDPKHGTALFDLAILQNQTGRKQEAEQNLKLLSTLPDKAYRPAYAIFLFQQEGRRDEGIREFERLAKSDPQDRVARTQLISAYATAGRLPDAQRVLADVLKKNPKDLDALLQLGEISLNAHNYDQAEGDFNQVVRMKPDSPEVHYALGKLYLARGATNRYREELLNALRINPFIVPVRLELAQVLIDTDGQNGARAALDVLDSAPASQKDLIPVIVKRNWALWFMKDFAEMRKGIDRGLARQKTADLLLQDGAWKAQAGNLSGAQTVLEQALSMDSNDLSAMALLNQTYVAQKQAGLALKKVKEFAARQPKSATAQEFLGLVLLANGDRTQARTAFTAAKAIDPHYSDASLSLARLDGAERKWDDADSELKTLLSNDPGNSAARLLLGEVEAAKGETSAALERFRKVVENNPNNAEALNNLAYLLMVSTKQTDEALKYAEKAVELAPVNADYADTLGWVLYQKGLYGPAITHLERAAAKNGNVAWKYHLAMAYAKAGDQTKAQTTLKMALKVDPHAPEAEPAVKLVGSPK